MNEWVPSLDDSQPQGNSRGEKHILVNWEGKQKDFLITQNVPKGFCLHQVIYRIRSKIKLFIRAGISVSIV